MIRRIKEYVLSHDELEDGTTSHRFENEETLVKEMLKKLNINEDELDSMEPSELKARIRDYNIDTILK